ncbi:MAG: substrate-binding domain-containing protein [Proteobacteria bacterium]|nr:substrate-binding domain-containing protein [Pseudomonadota bacterium]
MIRSLLVGMLLVGCAGPTADEDDGKRVVRVSGSTSVNARLLPALAAEYERLHPDVTFEITQGDSGTGLMGLANQEVDIAAATRRHHPTEQEQALVNGIDLSASEAQQIVAVDVLALVVHPANPLASLTYDQVIGIYCTRATDSWDLLGHEEQPIRAVTRDVGSGSRALFDDFFCGPAGLHPSIEGRSSEELAAILTSDPNAIGYASMSDKPGKVLGLRPDPQSPAVQPSQANIIRGVYPLYRDLYLYRAPNAANDDVAGFFDFIESPAGQEIVDEEGFVPLFLRPDRMDGPRPLRETIHFEPHGSALTPRSQARLRLLSKELRDRAGEYRHVVLEGYTDSKEENPEQLSTERAEAVSAVLKTELPELFIEVIPRGSANPLAPNATPHGRHRNRRVQIYLAEEEAEPNE